MTSIGASQKRGTTARGFRGVGRLAGLGYAQGLLFRSRSQKNANVYEVQWDCRLLKSLLGSSEFNGDLEGLVRKIVSVRKVDNGNYPDHFFEVEIVNPRRIGSDRLLNELEIGAYLSQVAPCPMNPNFKFTEQIREILGPVGSVAQEYKIFLNESDTPIYRPYTNKIVYSDSRTGNIESLSEISIDGIAGNPAATGWILHHDYQGAIPTSLGIKGLRARIGNIQIGDDRIFSNVFPEDRFCSWTIGEVHIKDQKVVPNGRRDNFESNNHIANVITHLTPYASEVARQCRSSSQIRNRKKTFELAEQRVLEKLDIIGQGVISNRAATMHKREIGTHLSEMKQAISFDLLKGKVRLDLESRLVEVESLVDYSSNLIGSDTPLFSLSKSKQNTYREIFDLIYECSANGVIAKSLIDRILSRISKS